MQRSAKIFIAGHRGMVGSALVRCLTENGFDNLILRPKKELDLMRQEQVEGFFQKEKPDYVFLAAAKVGGILANNSYPAEFIFNNLIIQTNIIHAAWKSGVKRLLFLGSSCIYPKDCPQPMREDHLLTGPLEATNEPYAVAKIAGIKMCQSYNRQYDTRFLAVMPTNLYGPNDNYDLETSHVLPALLRKFHDARMDPDGASPPKPVEIWGTGTPRREFLHADDLAAACLFLMQLEEDRFDTLIRNGLTPLVNIGYGKDITIRELALLIRDIVGFQGDIVFDETKPDGTPRKLLDVTRMTAMGWQPEISLKEGIRRTYEWCNTQNIF